MGSQHDINVGDLTKDEVNDLMRKLRVRTRELADQELLAHREMFCQKHYEVGWEYISTCKSKICETIFIRISRLTLQEVQDAIKKRKSVIGVISVYGAGSLLVIDKIVDGTIIGVVPESNKVASDLFQL